MAPEVTSVRPGQRYCGMVRLANWILCFDVCGCQMADVWSCGVTLYAMLTMRFPFCPTANPRNARDYSIYQRIMAVDYTMPSSISSELRDLFSKIFVKNPMERITVEGIKSHPWFLTDLPDGALDLTENCLRTTRSLDQTELEIRDILREAEVLYDENQE